MATNHLANAARHLANVYRSLGMEFPADMQRYIDTHPDRPKRQRRPQRRASSRVRAEETMTKARRSLRRATFLKIPTDWN